tara:strand:+ start:70 stop:858 length:789 start_codon:yes stop_codon:yes gene_type:complete
MRNALIGHSGFIGSSLKKQIFFNFIYRKNTIHSIQNEKFDNVICAGAPGQKWLANKKPTEDLKNINYLIKNLKTIKTKNFILISTVDIFKNPINVDENSEPQINQLHPYGIHRLKLETFVRNNFKNYLIVRLPGLVGKGLKKNIIYDLLNENNLSLIDSRSIFQFYPIKNLWNDIIIALNHNLTLIHLTSTPMKVEEISKIGFNKLFVNKINKIAPKYDFKTIHAKLYKNNLNYQYNKDEIFQAIKYYAQNEPKNYKNLNKS